MYWWNDSTDSFRETYIFIEVKVIVIEVIIIKYCSLISCVFVCWERRGWRRIVTWFIHFIWIFTFFIFWWTFLIKLSFAFSFILIFASFVNFIQIFIQQNTFQSTLMHSIKNSVVFISISWIWRLLLLLLTPFRIRFHLLIIVCPFDASLIWESRVTRVTVYLTISSKRLNHIINILIIIICIFSSCLLLSKSRLAVPPD